nr:uncharacterized protein LOC109765228 [Aegilops tauschii subsp. strangulata]
MPRISSPTRSPSSPCPELVSSISTVLRCFAYNTGSTTRTTNAVAYVVFFRGCCWSSPFDSPPPRIPRAHGPTCRPHYVGAEEPHATFDDDYYYTEGAYYYMETADAQE